MSIIKWSLALSCISILGICSFSGAFEPDLTKEKIKEASDYGARYNGKEIFGSKVVKKACFGKYPSGDGGIVMTKYIHTAVISAMMNLKEKSLSDSAIKDIEESTTFSVVIVTSDENVITPDDVQIILKQGTNTILPVKTEFGMKRKDNKQNINSVFQNNKVNPDANISIVVRVKNEEKKYKVDLSDIN